MGCFYQRQQLERKPDLNAVVFNFFFRFHFSSWKKGRNVTLPVSACFACSYTIEKQSCSRIVRCGLIGSEIAPTMFESFEATCVLHRCSSDAALNHLSLSLFIDKLQSFDRWKKNKKHILMSFFLLSFPVLTYFTPLQPISIRSSHFFLGNLPYFFCHCRCPSVVL